MKAISTVCQNSNWRRGDIAVEIDQDFIKVYEHRVGISPDATVEIFKKEWMQSFVEECVDTISKRYIVKNYSLLFSSKKICIGGCVSLYWSEK